MITKRVSLQVHNSDPRLSEHARQPLSQPTISLIKRSTSPKLFLARKSASVSGWRHRISNRRIHVTKRVLIKVHDSDPCLSEQAPRSQFQPTTTLKKCGMGPKLSVARNSALVFGPRHHIRNKRARFAKRVLIKVHDSDPCFSEQGRIPWFQPTISLQERSAGPRLLIARKSALILEWRHHVRDGRIYVVECVLIKVADSDPDLGEQGRIRFQPTSSLQKRSTGPRLLIARKSALILGWRHRIRDGRIHVVKCVLIKVDDSDSGLGEQGRIPRFQPTISLQKRSTVRLLIARQSALTWRWRYRFRNGCTHLTNCAALIKVHNSGPGLGEQARKSVVQPTIQFKKQPGFPIARKNSLILGGEIVLITGILGAAEFRVALPVANS